MTILLVSFGIHENMIFVGPTPVHHLKTDQVENKHLFYLEPTPQVSEVLGEGMFGTSQRIHSNTPVRNVHPVHESIGGIILGQQWTRHQAKRPQDWEFI